MRDFGIVSCAMSARVAGSARSKCEAARECFDASVAFVRSARARLPLGAWCCTYSDTLSEYQPCWVPKGEQRWQLIQVYQWVAREAALMLADFDGDGLPDLLYAGPGATSYSIAVLNKPTASGQPYAFASAIPAAFFSESGSACSLADVAFGTENSSRTDAIDIDGDGRADVHFVLEQTSPCSGATAGLDSATGSSDDAPQSPTDTRPFYLKTFRSQGVQSGTFRFQAYNWLNMNFSLRDDSAGAVFGRFRMR